MNTYIDLNGGVVHTSLARESIANECCQVCSATMLRMGLWACDYPVIEDHGLTRKVHKTCDAILCNSHAYKIAEQVSMQDEQGDFIDDVHICPAHFEEWKRFGEKPFWIKGCAA